MTVHVLQARSLPLKTPGQILQSQVRIVLLPLKKQKFKSKIRNGENPQYMESFVLHKINPEDVHGLGLRIRIYGCERMRRQRLLGEAAVRFASLNLELENGLWLQLAPRQHHQPSLQLPKLELTHSITGLLASPSSITTVGLPGVGSIAGGEACSLARSDSASSCCSARSAPELLLGLQYNSTTGHLSVEVIKGTHFRKLSPTKAPDTYVKLSLISSLGMEMGRCKSTTRRAQSNPLYKELFIFQVALFQLSEVTLMVSVWWRRSVKRNEMVGWFSLGQSPSGREEERHWQELCERQGEQVQRWHVLQDS
ncbi:synaptotagmin-16 [Hyposmocoma kahamanoa]|uniref:synaptotagmin-16 n=1 Tax=Hyposmocoma kahamanoa TaxID=1477025 RepID=UPI000E6D81AB|nr:synaptotagmin-16 [Hyposmocoma kahamanoa]